MPFFRIIPFLFCMAIAFGASAQPIGYAKLQSILSMEEFQIDTLMKKNEYKLLQRDGDSTSSMHYYSNLQKITDGPAWVRSITVMDARINGLSSRLVRYRTYSKEEYQELLAGLLADHFRTAHKFQMGNATHFLYENEDRRVTVKLINTPLNNGKVLPTYEFEFGR